MVLASIYFQEKQNHEFRVKRHGRISIQNRRFLKKEKNIPVSGCAGIDTSRIETRLRLWPMSKCTKLAMSMPPYSVRLDTANGRTESSLNRKGNVMQFNAAAYTALVWKSFPSSTFRFLETSRK
jgi:hypothetical protein